MHNTLATCNLQQIEVVTSYQYQLCTYPKALKVEMNRTIMT